MCPSYPFELYIN
jgi:hypothetical protein